MKQNIDIVIPCFNPIVGWANGLIQSHRILSKDSKYNFKFILVNDGSEKGISQNDIDELEDCISNFEYLTYDENRGKGYAVRYGAKQSKSEYLIFTDIDFPYGEQAILNILKALESGADLILTLRDNSYYNNISTSRKLISQLLKKTIKSFFKIAYSDTQGGLKGMSNKGKDNLLKTTIDRYLFDLELVKMCTINELVIKGIPSKLRDNIELSSVGISILIREISNFIKIWRL